ncbi:hypothetical protein HDV05_002949 [Chytridiales sp. JEL 0842]|nr:hypothetical protein HDV05_002949 [Chytridiales sp. JEL 0842]
MRFPLPTSARSSTASTTSATRLLRVTISKRSFASPRSQTQEWLDSIIAGPNSKQHRKPPHLHQPQQQQQQHQHHHHQQQQQQQQQQKHQPHHQKTVAGKVGPGSNKEMSVSWVKEFEKAPAAKQAAVRSAAASSPSLLSPLAAASSINPQLQNINISPPPPLSILASSASAGASSRKKKSPQDPSLKKTPTPKSPKPAKPSLDANNKDPIQRAAAELIKSHTSPSLLTLSRSIGLSTPQPATKQVVSQKVAEHLYKYHLNPTLATPTSIIGIDVGVLNLGVCVLVPTTTTTTTSSSSTSHPHSPSVKIAYWDLINLQQSESTPFTLSSLSPLSSSMLPLLNTLTPFLGKNSQILIERQSFRFHTASALPVVKSIMAECVLFGLLRGHLHHHNNNNSSNNSNNNNNKQEQEGTVRSVLPRSVGDHFSLNELSENKKRAAGMKVQEIFSEGRKVEVSKEMKGFFEGSKKKDDLADSMLMALGGWEWGQASLRESRVLFGEGK